jgi:hypothetical protein
MKAVAACFAALVAVTVTSAAAASTYTTANQPEKCHAGCVPKGVKVRMLGYEYVGHTREEPDNPLATCCVWRKLTPKYCANGV